MNMILGKLVYPHLWYLHDMAICIIHWVGMPSVPVSTIGMSENKDRIISYSAIKGLDMMVYSWEHEPQDTSLRVKDNATKC